MCGRFSGWLRAAALASAAAIFVQSPAQAADAAGFAPGFSGPQIMLYLRWSVGVHGLGATTFGLRYERTSPVYAESATRFAASMRHRPLVDLEFTRGVAPRMSFGPRVTWEMGRGKLGPTQLVVPTWPMAISGPAAATQLSSWLP
jgi:hypothetical protein